MPCHVAATGRQPHTAARKATRYNQGKRTPRRVKMQDRTVRAWRVKPQNLRAASSRATRAQSRSKHLPAIKPPRSKKRERDKILQAAGHQSARSGATKGSRQHPVWSDIPGVRFAHRPESPSVSRYTQEKDSVVPGYV